MHSFPGSRLWMYQMHLQTSHIEEPLIMRNHSTLKPEEVVGRVSENLWYLNVWFGYQGEGNVWIMRRPNHSPRENIAVQLIWPKMMWWHGPTSTSSKVKGRIIWGQGHTQYLTFLWPQDSSKSLCFLRETITHHNQATEGKVSVSCLALLMQR